MDLAELRTRLDGHLKEQAEKWSSFAYAFNGYYQGYERIGIPGSRGTEERWKHYALESHLKGKKRALDIGCNNGFFATHLAGFVGHVDALDINPYLVAIGRDAADWLGVKNISFHATKFEDFPETHSYDVVFSLANDDTIDGNTAFTFDEYLAKIHRLLEPRGLLVWESVAPDAADPSRFMPKLAKLMKSYEVVEERKVPSKYPTNVPFRFFLVLRKKA